MPIYKRNNKYYAKVNYKDDDGKYKSVQSKYFDTKREAMEEEARLRSNFKLLVSSDITFKQAYDEYVKAKEIRGVHYRTIQRYNEFYNALGSLVNKKVKDIKQSDFDELKPFLEDKYATSKYILTFARAVFKYASSKYNILIPNIQLNYYNEKKPKQKLNFYTLDEFNKFIECVDDQLYKTLFLLLFYNGLRISEARGLTFNDVDGKHININKQYYKADGINTKLKTNNSYRVLPVNKMLKDNLEALKKTYTKMYGYTDDWYVFGGIKPVAETSIAFAFNKAQNKANVHKIRIHDFRHSCASYYIHLNYPMNLIAELLGDNINTIYKTYYHLYKNDLDDMINSAFESKIA